MIIKFSPEELKQLRISHLPEIDLSDSYIQERDEYWDEIVKRGAEQGKEFWNGKLYTFVGVTQTQMNNPSLILSTMNYSDRLFKRKFGTNKIVEKYGEEYLRPHCGVSIIVITSDNKYIIGEKKNSTALKQGLYSHISGNLNEDESKVDSLEDLYKFAQIEIEEESGIKVDRT